MVAASSAAELAKVRLEKRAPITNQYKEVESEEEEEEIEENVSTADIESAVTTEDEAQAEYTVGASLI
jgi:hypothetical protein